LGKLQEKICKNLKINQKIKKIKNFAKNYEFKKKAFINYEIKSNT
tara:strand:- start:14 stop:148 length:135 start_codon:yes stop_codon:yes gene_type:complete